MNLKLFYDQKWLAFEAPEKPRQWDYESGGDPPMIAPYLDNGYFYALEVYEKAYAEAKANALEVGNHEVISGLIKFRNDVAAAFSKPEVGAIEGIDYDWKGSAVIKDGKYILSV